MKGMDLKMTGSAQTRKVVRRHKRGPLEIGNFGNAVICIILALFCLSCVLPILLVYIVSFTDELAITRNGVSFFPAQWSLEAYRMLFGSSLKKIAVCYRNTLFLTVVGTLLSLWFMTMYGYALSRKDFKPRQFLTFFAYFTMLFSGGMVAGYIVNTTIFHLRDTIWVLLLPGLVGAYNIIVLRTFFSSGGNEALIEAAKIDGANRLQIVLHVNIPHILPTIVTLLILRTGSVLSVGFEKIFLMQTPLNLEASRVLSTYVYEMGIQNSRLDYSTAVGLFNNVVNVVVLILVNTVAKKVSKIGLF